jgi:hypothetical protein
MAGYVKLLTEAKTPAAHIILKTGGNELQEQNYI